MGFSTQFLLREMYAIMVWGDEMRNYNVIAVIDAVGENALVCLRRKPPYQGLYNFVGGKIEPGEDGFDAAYRELQEETGISRNDIALVHLMTMEYPIEGNRMEVYGGRLKGEVTLIDEVNKLFWLPLTEDFTDTTRFAGVGNLNHILSYLKKYTNIL